MARPFFYLFSLNILSFCIGEDILGCNGFVRSVIPINYSDVQVKLFTKQGSLKDYTECAPNNGYYFLPLYDKGDYILKVVPPDGWTFEPSEVLLSIDGFSDPCSQGKDINFEFKGFAVKGKVVSSKQEIGPAGVSVELYLKDDSRERVAETTTVGGGDFTFTPVLPGNYTIRITHPLWKLERNKAYVKVDKENGQVTQGALSVAGYDVSGSVTSDNQPITGVSFVLFSNDKKKTLGCDSSPLTGFRQEETETGEAKVLLCHSTSNSRGVFTFPCLEPGDYVLVPHYSGSPTTKFDVYPRSLSFTVSHSSLTLPVVFQVRGFTVVGRVMWSRERGAPMANAVVYLNGKEVARTNEEGLYTLDSMRAGTYTIKVTADDVQFDEETVKVTSTSLEDLYPAKYKTCGALYSALTRGPYKVKVSSGSSTSEEELDTLTTSDEGKFCTFLKPGLYTFSPAVGDDQRTEGLLFSPSWREVKVTDKPVTGIDFSQLRSRLRGNISCMTPSCPSLTVLLRPRSSAPTLQVISQDGEYEFSNVTPGEYDVYIEPGLGWCWERETMALSVINELTHIPPFVQSGFTVTIMSSHQTKVNYWPETEEKEKQEMTVSPGSTHLCVARSVSYLFEPTGCHGYRSQQMKWSRGGNPVDLTAVSHANTFHVESNHPIPDLTVTVRSKPRSSKVLDSNEKKSSGEAESEETRVSVARTEQKPGVWRYELTVQLAEGELVTVSPSASISLFTPTQVQLKGASDCVNISKPLFRAEKGQVISGWVRTGDGKGLAGVSISVLDEDGSPLHSELSSTDGSYKFPPIKTMAIYRLSAAKEGYVFIEESTKGNFNAHKLAEIVVTVKDKNDNSPLQGVLLSLSGGKDYRRNAQTDGEGRMSFLSLRPGDYFLRPMMKEYRFTPQNKILSVEEGATVHFLLSGERVAYSAHGKVVSLNGEGEGGVVVEAVGRDGCSTHQEEATSSLTGHFRIRGLQPKCTYSVRVKKGVDVNEHVSKSTPDNITVKIDKEDVSELSLYVVGPEWRTDVVVEVIGESPEELRSLRVKLSLEELPESSLHSVRLSDYKPSSSGYALSSVVLAFPSLPADGRGYIVRLDSSLSQATHYYVNRPVHFKANSSLKVVKMRFEPRLRAKEAELSQSSYVVLPLLLLLGVALYRKEDASSLFTALSQARLPFPSLAPSRQEELLSSESAVFLQSKKAKAKSRKL